MIQVLGELVIVGVIAAGVYFLITNVHFGKSDKTNGDES